MFEINKLMDSV